MGSARFSFLPGRGACAAVRDIFTPKFIFIPLFIILVAACLLLAGCTDEEVIGPGGGGDDNPDDPICPINTPWVEIVSPDVGDATYYPPRIDFSWEQDPEYKIAFTRYLITELEPGEIGTEMLNEDPGQFEGLWSEWREWDPAGDSTVIGGDSPLENGIYLFAVQARDSCGKETDHFDLSSNARQFPVSKIYPFLAVLEPTLGTGIFIDTEHRPPTAYVLPHTRLAFRWNAEPTYSWFGPIEYRYGWDIQNLGDDNEWTFPWSSQVGRELWSRSDRFTSGVHIFYVEARDDAGTITRARIEVEVIEFTRDRDLLWIDDMLLGANPIPERTHPSETEHDEFWIGICSIAPGFIPDRDVYEADIARRGDPIPLEVLARYKNVIWTFDRKDDNAWSRTIEFTPIAGTYSFPSANNLRIFLAAGGNALTCGYGYLSGSALSAIFPEDPLFPASVTEDLADYNYDLEFARSSMVHDDYYVTVIDKVIAPFRTDLPGGVIRSLDRDAMRMALKDEYAYARAFPDTLRLWDEITQPGMFFDPMNGGFTYVEVYDPEYYMEYRLLRSRSCFRPIYRMKSQSTLSPLNNTAIALWTMDHDCEYDESTDAYPIYYRGSAHFGLPLWFIDHEQVETIAASLYYKWGID